MSKHRILTGIKPFIYLLLLLLIAGCRQFPGHYIAFNSCLQENTTIGEDFLVAYAELENFLLAEGYLNEPHRPDYAALLQDLATENRSISWRSAAPQVRDFWGLQQEITFGAFPLCAQQVSAGSIADEAGSLSRLSSVYEKFYDDENATFRNPELLQSLSDAVSDEDFGFLLYRAPLLTFVVYLME
ncbi:MAG: hypothetical protein LAT75_03870 [Candidatus Cyclonatronum sp.]|uniref:hypothetical protein n=1 Tax=Cyclonatronum sp. TaxID=3024185 RepID=UPI0025C5FD17|nr:hypothetical protein [Cyclonatronum sp.]MCC5933402.1 hypothetical protein [Balneolales bacterium]MCH8485976.1 hypothetical protein [Cyclonatronum sp.]